MDIPIYNSRIVKNYLNFIGNYYPDLDLDLLLDHAGITAFEVEDPGHWFSQRQMDRFHDILVEKTGNLEISREAGRYNASSKGMGPIREYTLGFMSPAFIYQAFGKVLSRFVKNVTITSKKCGADKVEIIVTPEPGSKEKPQQCQSRIGGLESISMFFTGKYANVEHPDCFHHGGGYCRYIITWTKMPSKLWKRVRNITTVGTAAILALLFATLPLNSWIAAVFTGFCVVALQTIYSLHLERRELVNTIHNQKDTAREHLDQLNARYNNCLLYTSDAADDSKRV